MCGLVMASRTGDNHHTNVQCPSKGTATTVGLNFRTEDRTEDEANIQMGHLGDDYRTMSFGNVPPTLPNAPI